MNDELSVHNLGSGSSGNALLIRAGGAALLIDCGISRSRLRQAMNDASLCLANLAAIAISHEHGDHTVGLDHLPRAGTPLLATRGTLAALGPLGRGGRAINDGDEVEAGPFRLKPLAVRHDAAEPCGYTIEAIGRRITVMTDLGQPPNGVLDILAISDLIVLEANYDRHMLASGPYPPRLKQRIVSGSGHLSNDQCGQILAAALANAGRRPVIWLAHLSKTNNRPDIAERTVERHLQAVGLDFAAIAMIRAGGNVWNGEPGDSGRPRTVQLSLDF